MRIKMKGQMRERKVNSGFSIVELVIAVAIMVPLSLVLVVKLFLLDLIMLHMVILIANL